MHEKGIDPTKMADYFREKAFRPNTKEVFISKIPPEELAGSTFAKINCDGYGILRKSVTNRAEDWPEINILSEVASSKLGVAPDDLKTTQIFRNGACNYRCWFCFVDFQYLKCNPELGDYKTAEELLDLHTKEPEPARIISLTGGQPDITPEWTLWTMQALEQKNMQDTHYLWQDDNLSSYSLWNHLKPEEIEHMRNYKNYGRATCIKGISPENFYKNTNSAPANFYRQIDVLKKLVIEGFDIYTYLILLEEDVVHAQKAIPLLLDTIQKDVHPNMPLRIFPSKVVEYNETIKRSNPIRERMLQNQYALLEIWNSEMEKRFSAKEREVPKSQVNLTL